MFRNKRIMKASYLIQILISIIFSYSCSGNTSLPSGNPDDVLSLEQYDKIQSMYDNISVFENGTAIVIKNNGYGLINYKGKEVLPCSYDLINSSNDGIRIITLNSKKGLIDVSGNFIVKCIYDDVYMNFFNYIPLKRHNKWGFIDKKGELKLPFKYDNVKYVDDSIAIVKYNNLFGIIDYGGKTIIDFKYDNIWYRPFRDSNISFLKSNNKIGIINSSNKIVTECIYDNLAIPQDDYLSLTKGKSLNHNTDVHGMIKAETGEVAIPFIYEDLGNYSEGLIMAKKDGKYGYLDINNNIIIPFIYEDAKDFSQGKALVYKQTGYVNTIIGLIPQRKCGYINNNGDVVIPIKFDDQLFGTPEFREGLASIGVRENSIYATKFGYIDTTGQFIIEPFFQKANPFKNGLAEVTVSDKIGFIDKKGNYVIQCIYDERNFEPQLGDSIISLTKDNIKFNFDYKGNKKGLNTPTD